MQGYIDGRLRSFERLTIHEDVIRVYVSLLAQRGDFAVDDHAAGGDVRFTGATRAVTGAGHDLLQAFFHRGVL